MSEEISTRLVNVRVDTNVRSLSIPDGIGITLDWSNDYHQRVIIDKKDPAHVADGFLRLSEFILNGIHDGNLKQKDLR